MADDNKREILNFSKSGKVLKKTLKVKEMDETEEGIQEIFARPFPSSSYKTKAMNIHGVHKVSRSNTSGSSSTLYPFIMDTSVCNSLDSEMQKRKQEASSYSENSTYFQAMIYKHENSNNDISTEEFSGSTYEANYTPKSRFKTIVNVGTYLKNLPSKLKITKCSHSTAIDSVKSKCKSNQLMKISERKSKKKQKSFRNVFINRPLENIKELVDHPVGIGPKDIAAHLALLGENLYNLGLVATWEGIIGQDPDPHYWSCLLIAILSAVGPLLCLTKEIAGLEKMKDDVFVKILDHQKYLMSWFQSEPLLVKYNTEPFPKYLLG